MIIMDKIDTIMDRIRDSPVCPESGETNLLYIIIIHTLYNHYTY